jgi:hypothetical protein
MMTVFESLAHWLWEILTDPENGFEGNFAVDVEVLPELEKDGYQSTSLHSNPNDISKQLLGGQRRHEKYKTFYVRRNFTDTTARIENESFFEKLEKRVYLKDMRGVYPQDGRKWRSIGLHGGAYPGWKSPNNDYAVYQVNIKLVYEE